MAFTPTYRRSTRLILALLLVCSTGCVFGAGFDCTKASSATELRICKSPELSRMDDKLQQAYKGALATTDSAGRRALVKEQRHWIAYTRDICQNDACLKQVYAARIDVLARNEKDIIDQSSCEVPKGGTECVNVVVYRDPNLRVRSFDQSLAQAKQTGQIIGCSRLVNLPVGTAGSNNSFGGRCTLQDGAQRKAVEICNDDMFGHFEMRPAEPPHGSDKDLVDFTYAHCFGG